MQLTFRYGSILGAQAVVFIFVMYFYRESYRYEKTLVQSNDELTILSELDSLTGLLNRRSFSERIASEWDKSVHTGQPLSLLMLDADKFKAFNDYYGHPAGDDVLRKISVVLKDNIRLDGTSQDDTGEKNSSSSFLRPTNKPPWAWRKGSAIK
jgi:predicted signal transduction protein with EAL and GGDEF domain